MRRRGPALLAVAKREPRPDWRAHKALVRVPTGSMPSPPRNGHAELPELLKHPSAPAAAIRRVLLRQHQGRS